MLARCSGSWGLGVKLGTMSELTPANSIELILAKQLSELLSVPLFLLDEGGRLLHYNHDASTLLGERGETEAELTRSERVKSIALYDEQKAVVSHLEEPMMSALQRGVPEHRHCWVKDRVSGYIEVELTAFPICGLTRDQLGVIALLYPVVS